MILETKLPLMLVLLYGLYLTAFFSVSFAKLSFQSKKLGETRSATRKSTWIYRGTQMKLKSQKFPLKFPQLQPKVVYIVET